MHPLKPTHSEHGEQQQLLLLLLLLHIAIRAANCMPVGHAADCPQTLLGAAPVVHSPGTLASR